MLWPRKGSLMKTQTRIFDNRLYYTRKIELRRKGKKSRTVRITPILICPLAAKSLVLIMVRRVHFGDMGKAPSTVNKSKEKLTGILVYWKFWDHFELVFIGLSAGAVEYVNETSRIGLDLPQTNVLDMRLDHPIERIQSWSFDECGVHFHCHYSQIHSDSEL